MKTKEEGVIYVSAAGTYFDKPSIDADKLRDTLRNNYMQEQLGKTVNKVCTGMYTLTVKDAAGEANEEVAKRMLQMCESPGVRMWARMKQSCRDIIGWGPFIYNPVWDQEGSEVYLLKVRRLPPETFAEPAAGRKIYNEILEGITLGDTGELELWQTGEDGKAVQLSNAQLMKDRSSEDLGGTSMVITLVPIVSMLDFCWQCQMQKVNRVGSPIFFIKVNNPKGDDIAYAQKMLNRWGKDSAFQLRANMDVVELNLQDNEAALNTISKLEARIKQFFSGASSIQKEGSTLGGNADAEKEMDDEAIASLRTLLEDEWEALLQQYLDENHYVGWTVELKLASKAQSPGTLQATQARTGFDTQCMTINERREKLGQPALSDEDIEKLLTENARLDPQTAAIPAEESPFGNVPLGQVERRAKVLKSVTDIDPMDPERYVSQEEQLAFLGRKKKEN
ncbi:MAG: hypothetical protein WC375_06975 [Methanomassiliicoccales archaeon]|jgi:hypothetical protein